jgi:hypothetical protein
MTFVDCDVNSLYAGVPFGTLSIFASGASGSAPKFSLTRDHSLKQTFVVTVSRPDWGQLKLIASWVDETFGARTAGYHNPRWSYDGYSKWCFRKEADAMLFIMRWS